MAFLQIFLLAISFFVAVNCEQCEMIRVDKGDDYGTRGTCCILWDKEYTVYKTNRKFIPGLLGGIGLGAGIGGYINDSAGRNISGGLGGVLGPGLIANPGTPAPVAPAPAYTPPANAPSAYPYPGPPVYEPPVYPHNFRAAW